MNLDLKNTLRNAMTFILKNGAQITTKILN